MRIQTRSFGEIEATPESFLTLPEGLVGFEDQHDFVLVHPTEYAPFAWLLSFADPSLAFPLLPARLVAPDYAPALSAADRKSVGAVEGDVFDVYVLAATDAATHRLTANLRAPIVVHPTTRLARQVVLSDGRWTVDHPVGGSTETVAANATRHDAEARPAA